MSAGNPLRIEQRHASRLHRDGLAHSDDALVHIGSIDRKLDRAGKTYADGCGNDFRVGSGSGRQQQEKHGELRETAASIGDDIETGTPHFYPQKQKPVARSAVFRRMAHRLDTIGGALRFRACSKLNYVSGLSAELAKPTVGSRGVQSTLMPASLMNAP